MTTRRWILSLAWLFTSCSSTLLSPQVHTHTLALQGTPQACYVQATHAFAQMGGTVQASDPATRTLSGVMHGVVQLTVVVDPQSTVHVRSHLLPGKLVIGTMDEGAQYLALLHQKAGHGC
jgi:hypothetical protein